jgi:GNAT superfamily N-acetyltransferase
MADHGGYTIKALTTDTWGAFADLVERHNGVWNGCWCTWFITVHAEKTHTVGGNRALKKQRVEEGTNHAALVFDGDRAVAWCEYGTPEELPNIYHRKEYEEGLTRLPDYRLTCFFVDRGYRRKGVGSIALQGALDLIADVGGGVVEAYPHDTGGKKVSASFLYNGTRQMFEEAGFTYDRPKGKKNCVMVTTVAAARRRGRSAAGQGGSRQAGAGTSRRSS